jgi:hypothetical protein
MKELMNHNIYEFKDNLVICGSCLENMDKDAYEKLKEISSNIYYVCLEKIHMNMVAHKIASILKIGNIKKLIFALVDKSPHCVQLHYISEELKKIMNLKGIEIKNYVSNKKIV